MFKFQTTTQSGISVNRVLRNTYLLLAASLIFSALAAGYAMANNMAQLNTFIVILGYFGFLFLTSYLRNSKWGIVAVFGLTGFMGLTLGPILNLYMNQIVNGEQIVFTALGATGIIFLSLSGYVLITKKDFSYLAAFLLVGIMTAFICGLAAMIFKLPMLSLIVSAAFVLLSSGMILFETSRVVNGGETNAITVTVSLFVSIFNIFLSLLHLLTAFSNR